jgi:ribosomal protein L40E
LSNRNRTKNKIETRLPVDQTKWGANCSTYDLPPEYYYDKEIICSDCGAKETWTAKQQKWWYEQAGANINAVAKRCSKCRAHVKALKEEQKRHMDEMANKKPHPNEEFFKKKFT